MGNFLESIIGLLTSLLAVAIVLSLHEFAHAYVACRCGDLTPKYAGRLTLNPLKHFDPLGLILFAVAGFGWAKPVPINPNNFNHYRRGLAFTSVAGILINYLSVFIFYPLFLVVVNFVQTPFVLLDNFLFHFTSKLTGYSLGFAVFNLIPLRPLDGWNLIDSLSHRRGKVFQFFQRNGNLILIILILIHFLTSFFAGFQMLQIAAKILRYIDILGYIMTYVTDFIATPIYLLWGLVF